MDHATRDQLLDLGGVRSHVRRGRVRLERLGIAPLFDHDECVGTKFRLEAAYSIGVNSRSVLDAAILGANGGNVGSKRFEYFFALARVGGEDGYNVDHEVSPWLF